MICYLICSSPRSGTNLLRHLLLGLKMGMPVEIHPEYIDLQVKPVEKVPSAYKIEYLHNFLRGVNFIPKRHDTGDIPPAIYSRIVWGFQFHELVDSLRQVGGVPDHVKNKDLLNHLYPNIKYIYLYRKDKVRQAVSIEAARQSGQWLVARREKVDKFTDYKYDFGGLAQEVLWRLDAEERWKDIFAEFRIAPLVINYEHFMKTKAMTLSKIVRYLGLPLNEPSEDDIQQILNHRDSPVKQTHPVKQEWEDLFCRDIKRIISYYKESHNANHMDV